MRKDEITRELPGVPGRRGRPPTGRAKSAVERQAAYRARLRATGREEVTAVLDADVADALRAYVARQNSDRADEAMTLGDAVERFVRDRLMRKR